MFSTISVIPVYAEPGPASAIDFTHILDGASMAVE
jgi:hypothetical protein